MMLVGIQNFPEKKIPIMQYIYEIDKRFKEI